MLLLQMTETLEMYFLTHQRYLFSSRYGGLLQHQSRAPEMLGPVIITRSSAVRAMKDKRKERKIGRGYLWVYCATYLFIRDAVLRVRDGRTDAPRCKVEFVKGTPATTSLFRKKSKVKDKQIRKSLYGFNSIIIGLNLTQYEPHCIINSPIHEAWESQLIPKVPRVVLATTSRVLRPWDFPSLAANPPLPSQQNLGPHQKPVP
jgi:hypothetical protein